MNLPIVGGCACSRVRYEIRSEPLMTGICHCRECQRSGGTESAPNFLVPAAAVALTGKTAFRRYTPTAGTASSTTSARTAVRRSSATAPACPTRSRFARRPSTIPPGSVHSSTSSRPAPSPGRRSRLTSRRSRRCRRWSRRPSMPGDERVTRVPGRETAGCGDARSTRRPRPPGVRRPARPDGAEDVRRRGLPPGRQDVLRRHEGRRRRRSRRGRRLRRGASPSSCSRVRLHGAPAPRDGAADSGGNAEPTEPSVLGCPGCGVRSVPACPEGQGADRFEAGPDTVGQSPRLSAALRSRRGRRPHLPARAPELPRATLPPTPH